MARPRDHDLDVAILAAARAIEAERGASAVTVSAVAERAGVTRATVYRRWPTRAALLFELGLSASVPSELPDLGSLRADLDAAIRYLVDAIADDDREILGSQISEMVRDRAFAARVWQRRWIPDRNTVLAIWDRAVARDEVDPGADGAAAIDDIVAVTVFRTLLWHRTDHDWVDAYLDRLLDGVLVRR